ncbi:MAG: two-component regulator propeller domain-containing protein, partial [Bacteroidota bacterium]
MTNHFTTQEGLANNIVNTITQDSTGFIWIGTQDGLSRFDGERFVNYRKGIGKGKELPDNRITTLLTTKKGEIYVGTEKGLAVLPSQSDTLREVNFFRGKVITSLIEDQAGSLWLTILDEKPVIYIKKLGSEWEYHPLNGIKNLRGSGALTVKEYQIRGKATIVLSSSVTNKEGGVFAESIYIWDEKASIWEYQLSTNHRTSHIDSTGRLFLAPFVVLDPKEKTYDQSPNATIKYVAIANFGYGHIDYTIKPFSGLEYQGYTYIVQSLGVDIVKVTHPTTRISFLGQDYFSKSNSYTLRGLFIDKADNLWIITGGAGVYLLNRAGLNKLSTYNSDSEKPETKLSGNSVRTMYQHTDKSLWVSSYNEQRLQDVFWSDGRSNALNLASGVAMSIRPDRFDENTIAMGGVYDLSIIDINSAKIKEYYLFPSGEVLGLEQLKDSSWLCATQKGLFRTLKDRGRTDEKYREGNDALHGNFLYKFKSKPTLTQYDSIEYTYAYRDRQNNIWLGTKYEGLKVWDEETETITQQFTHDPEDSTSLPSNFIKSIYQDTKNRYWITTPEGFALFDPKTNTCKRYTTTDGLPNMMTYGILEDDKGTLWISTNKGISHFYPETETFENFDKSDGLQDD